MSTRLVSGAPPPMKISLRHRLLAVALLGVFTCVLSLYALGRILSLNNQLRIDRARESVSAELVRLKGAAATGKEPSAPRTSLLGMRGGYIADGMAFDATDLDEPARSAVASVIKLASETRGAALSQSETSDEILVVGARPTDSRSVAWISYSSRPSPFMGIWRFIVVSMTLATLLLVGTAVASIVAVQGGAASLRASLGALVSDLRAPVPRPTVPELADIADRVAELAAALARAQVEKERLGGELAQRERLAALGRVVTGVAHEVRNPLASIKLRVDLGRQRAGMPPKLAEELAFVSDEITRLDRLVADLLVVAGRRSGPRAHAAVGALAERRAGLLRPWAEERRVRIEVQGDATAEIDADAVARAIDNLVRNAVEASPSGDAARVEIREAEDGVILRVSDHGSGVDEARAHELFEPFFTTKPEGTGLGLALSRAVATAHGGALTYVRRGGTTIFELALPRMAARAEAA